MKKSCKRIDITSQKTIEPYIKECLIRHRKRYSLQRLLRRLFNSTDNELERLKLKDYATVSKFSSKLSKIVAESIKRRAIPRFTPIISIRADKTTGKERLIGAEPAMQQFYDYVAVGACGELWKRRFVRQQCSSLPGRGQVYGMRMIRGYIQKDNRQVRYAKSHNLRYTRKCKYFVKMDIRKCYPSADREVLLNLLTRNIGNEDIIYLWKCLLDSYGRAKTPNGDPYTGILIGALPSQWAAQFLISYIYRFVMETGGASHMVMFMDDMLLMGPNRRKLKRLVSKTVNLVRDKLHMEIKPTWSIRKIDECGIDMMGYVVHANGKVTMRTRNFIHSRRLLMRMEHGRFGVRSAQRLVSYKGFFTNSDSSKAFRKYEAERRFKRAQRMLARKARAENESLL